MPLLCKKTGLADDPDWKDPGEVEPPEDRQFDLRETSLLTFGFRTAGRVEVVASADVEVLAKVPPPGGRGRPSWAPIGVASLTDSRIPHKLDVGGYTRAAIRFTNITAPGAAYVEVNGQPWRVSLEAMLTEALAVAEAAKDIAEGASTQSAEALALAENHASRHALGGADAVTLASLGDTNDWTRSSPVVTTDRWFSETTVVGSAFAYGMVARARAAGTFTKIRFMQRTNATTHNRLRAGVYNADGTVLLAQTADVVGLAGLNVYFESALDVPVTVAVNDVLVLALGLDFTGGSPTFQGRGHNSSESVNIAGAQPICYRSAAGGLTAGGMPAALNSPSGRNIMPWLELVP